MDGDERATRRRGYGLGPMKPLDLLLAINAGLLGIAGYILALFARNRGGWVLPAGIAVPLIGLVTASLATWRGTR